MKERDSEPCHRLTPMTRHAIQRSAQRGIPAGDIDMVLAYGRMVYTRGATVHAIGRREVAEALERDGIDLSRYEGIQVVCSHDGAVITTYRDHDFRGLRQGLGRGRYRPSSAPAGGSEAMRLRRLRLDH